MEKEPQANSNWSYRRFAAAAIGTALLGGLLLSATGALAGLGADRPHVLSLSEPRVVILKASRRLHLFDRDQLIRTYAIDLGSSPNGDKWRAGDGRTPLGRFRVATKNENSPHHRFLGINYPDEMAVLRGLDTGLISPGEAADIRRALAEGRCPDWSTGLGGGIGIHGGRAGRDWTAGCIAVADEHVEELFDVLRIGDPVEILP